ncbi:MAG: PEP-CTERM sorting domain-containing protein [Fischerella sp.]|jgi:hypothetical protein|uniref:LEVG family PEP-CTERM protein n=1 Tax=Fischerella sp. TaxID=1191 RepID=UPI00179241B7|nr:LEVG family PEP-CTERM protein [Fischerella sp.]NWF59622.1 PEP-CTERM sorting domain-containing protein [Fischerella sp.]
MHKLSTLAKTLVAFTVGLGVASAMSSAHAVSLVPQQEGEVGLTNITCLGGSVTCLDTTSMDYTVTSLAYDFDGLNPQYGLSRLFVDNRNTANDWGFGIKFKTLDAGTNPPLNEYWLRPVAYLADGTPAEGGQLEVGKFLFQFKQAVSEVTLDFLDVEDANFSGILAVNGNPFTQLLPAGSNNGIQSLTLNNVSSFVVQLGKPGPNSKFKKTGDGVNLQVSVPEPASTLGLGALAVVGMFGLRQRKKSVPAA